MYIGGVKMSCLIDTGYQVVLHDLVKKSCCDYCGQYCDLHYCLDLLALLSRKMNTDY